MADNSNPILEGVQEWWAFAAFVVGGLFSWLMGNARTQWVSKQNQEKLIALEKEVNSLKDAVETRNINIAVIKNDVDNIKTSVTEIKAFLIKLLDERK